MKHKSKVILKVIRNYRSSHTEVFLGKGVLKMCSKFTTLKNISGWLLLVLTFALLLYEKVSLYVTSTQGVIQNTL